MPVLERRRPQRTQASARSRPLQAASARSRPLQAASARSRPLQAASARSRPLRAGGGFSPPPAGGGGGFGPPPGGEGGGAAPAPKKNNTLKYVGIGCGALVLLSCLCGVGLNLFGNSLATYRQSAQEASEVGAAPEAGGTCARAKACCEAIYSQPMFQGQGAQACAAVDQVAGSACTAQLDAFKQAGANLPGGLPAACN